MKSNSDRITIVDSPVALPGNCGICGSADKECYADFRLDFEFYGALYFCNECVADLARTFGYALPDEVSSVQGRMAEAVTENIILKQKLKAAEAYIRESFSVDPGTVPGLTPDDILTSTLEVDEEGVIESGPDDSETDESVDEPRSDDVRNITKPVSTSDLSL